MTSSSSNPPSGGSPSSKLFIRSEVLAVINFLVTVEDPPKQDRVKQIKRLHGIEDQETVLKVLVKELHRTTQIQTIQVISELLMDLGTIEALQDPLWQLIQDAHSSDEVKDAANLILRQLGDQTDPNLYLEYLDDPAGLINRETERMLEVSTRNPEALIDFIDFIFSLPVDEQCNLILSLQNDYPPDYLLNIYIPTLEALPPLEVQELILTQMAQIRSKRTALFLHDVQPFYAGDARLSKVLKKTVNELKIAGVYKEELIESYRKELAEPHALVQASELYQCFATIADGIGNQGLVISRKKDNGDIAMMSVAINDFHGIIDCFGFYDLSEADFHKITEKFHEECSKIHTPVEYCMAKLAQAEATNRRNQFRIPYEYGCWKVILGDIDPSGRDLDTVSLAMAQAKDEWEKASTNLYQHPDFSTWFLEEEDHPVVTEMLSAVPVLCKDALSKGPVMPVQECIERLDTLAEALVHGLLLTEWREVLMLRLADATYLLNAQKATTFAGLAATEARKLRDYQGVETELSGFIKQYGRRCVEEDLLRLRQAKQVADERFDQLVDAVLDAWEI